MCECICVYTYVCIHTYIYTHAHTTHTHTNYVCEHTNINISACQLQKFVRCFVALKPSTQGLFPNKKKICVSVPFSRKRRLLCSKNIRMSQVTHLTNSCHVSHLKTYVWVKWHISLTYESSDTSHELESHESMSRGSNVAVNWHISLTYESTDTSHELVSDISHTSPVTHLTNSSLTNQWVVAVTWHWVRIYRQKQQKPILVRVTRMTPCMSPTVHRYINISACQLQEFVSCFVALKAD